MKFLIKSFQWLNPALHLMLALFISLMTAILAFRSIELERETLITFSAYYLILGVMTVMFRYRKLLTNSKTRQLLQFSFFLIGFVLLLTGILGIINSGMPMATVFLLVVFLPGLATLRAGLNFNKSGD